MGVDILTLYGHANGFARGIVWIMLLMSFFSLTVAIGKLIKMQKSTSATRKFAPQFSRAIQEEQRERILCIARREADKFQMVIRQQQERIGIRFQSQAVQGNGVAVDADAPFVTGWFSVHILMPRLGGWVCEYEY